MDSLLNISPLAVVRTLSAAFLAILFLQSGIDKILDWKGNLSWLKGHFAATPLRGLVPPMLVTVLICEVAAGILLALGGLLVLTGSAPLLMRAGAQVAGLSLTMLFFGQRIAKDYRGAADLVPYFVLTVITMLLSDEGLFA
ncbi:MAG: DoxX family protein [Bacteroidia bacterium]|jgi:uncharacterized membrane protein YphA (DoxX/SURF4 family)|nr:DoxX family protein [Bacteroidia bacterium]